MSYTLTGKRQEILERRKEVKRKTLEARRKYDGIVKEQELAPRVYITKRAKVSHSCTPHAPREDPTSDGPADKATVDNFAPREEGVVLAMLEGWNCLPSCCSGRARGFVLCRWAAIDGRWHWVIRSQTLGCTWRLAGCDCERAVREPLWIGV